MEQNFNLYHIFYTVAKCKNISGAARELFISQPAISKAIARLEQNLGSTLFLRSSRGVKLTEAGELLYGQVERAFSAISQGEQQLMRMQKLGIGHLTLGASATLCKYVLLPILQPFVRENPHIQISISCQSSYETIEALEKGSIDIGLIGGPESMRQPPVGKRIRPYGQAELPPRYGNSGHFRHHPLLSGSFKRAHPRQHPSVFQNGDRRVYAHAFE